MISYVAIGTLTVAIKHDLPIRWDRAHNAFARPIDYVRKIDCTLDIIEGPAPETLSEQAYRSPELADALLWQLFDLDRHGGGVAAHIWAHPQGAADMWLTLDACAKRGVLYMGDLPVPRFGYPVTPLLWSLLAARHGGLICHSCGVVTPEGEGLLLAGMSGHGKTTSARQWETVSGARILSDDRVALT